MSSRVAKKPVHLPSNVELTISSGSMTIKGPKGTITNPVHQFVSIQHEKDAGNVVKFSAATKDPNAWALAGTARALMNNMIVGVTEGFKRTLELNGVGYRAQASGKSLNLSLGFSHPVVYELPEGISAETPKQDVIVLSGIDKQKLGQAAAEIRSHRPPEPYKGKGIKYDNETIFRKEAKKK